jgi:hypothetical protein
LNAEKEKEKKENGVKSRILRVDDEVDSTLSFSLALGKLPKIDKIYNM